MNLLHLNTKRGNFIYDGINSNFYNVESEKISELIVENKIEQNAITLVLEVTSICNMNCTYCIYNDE